MATITTGGSGNWSSTTNNAPWPSGTKPTTNDVVEIAAGHTVTLDENTATLGAAGIKNATGSNTSVLDINGTVTINGNVSHSGTATTGFITYGTGDVLTINGQVTNSSTGTALVGSGSGQFTIANVGATALSVTNGVGITHNSTGTYSITGAMSITGGTNLLYHQGNCTGTVTGDSTITLATQGYRTGAGTLTVTGTTTANPASAAAIVPALRSDGGTTVFDGTLITSNSGMIVGPAGSGGTVRWVGSRAVAAGSNCMFGSVRSGVTVQFATATEALSLALSGSFCMISQGCTVTITSGVNNASIVRQSSAAQATILGDDTAEAIITGPTLPAAAAVQSGAADFGYAGSPLDPSYATTAATNAAHQAADLAFLNTNKDEMISANDSIRAQYGCDAGTAAGGGYTYGDNSAAKVLTTAAGAGSYVVPVVGQVLAPSQGGTAYGPSSGTSGTLTLPTASNVLTGSGAYGVNGSGSTPSYSPDFPAVGNVTTTDTVNGSAGTLDMSTYTLISGVVAAANVRNGTARYSGGSNGTAYIPSAANVRYGTSVDATTGTCHVPTAAQTQSGIAVDVSDTGTFTHTTDYVAKTDVVAAAYVLTGHDNYVGGSAGTYSPGAGYTYGDNSAAQVLTTATGAGSYHAPDAAEVISTAVFGPSSGTSGTYDVSSVSAGNIKTGISIGGVSGTFTHTADYTLTSTIDYPDAANVRNNDTVGGTPGTLDLSSYTLTASIDYPSTANVLSSDTVGGVAGTYHEATESEVQDGVHFGPASAYVGTLEVTGGTGAQYLVLTVGGA